MRLQHPRRRSASPTLPATDRAPASSRPSRGNLTRSSLVTYIMAFRCAAAIVRMTPDRIRRPRTDPVAPDPARASGRPHPRADRRRRFGRRVEHQRRPCDDHRRRLLQQGDRGPLGSGAGEARRLVGRVGGPVLRPGVRRRRRRGVPAAQRDRPDRRLHAPAVRSGRAEDRGRRAVRDQRPRLARARRRSALLRGHAPLRRGLRVGRRLLRPVERGPRRRQPVAHRAHAITGSKRTRRRASRRSAALRSTPTCSAITSARRSSTRAPLRASRRCACSAASRRNRKN